MRTLSFVVVLCSLPALSRAQDLPPRLAVTHAPRNETSDGTLVLSFDAPAIDRVGTIVVRYRAHGEAAFAEVVARRSADARPSGWTAEIPRGAIVPPSVDYYVVARAPGRADVPVFASAAYPHPVVVVETDGQWHEREELRLANRHRSRLSVLGEWIDYGNWFRCPVGGCVDPQRHVDRYLRSEVSYAYGMFGVVEWLRFSVSVLRGNYGLDGASNDVGLYTGAAEITWYAVSWFRVKTQLIFGISQTGFAAGGSGALVFGRDGDTQLTLAGGGVSDVGGNGSVRLSWHTVPHVPMAATVEVSSMPGGDRAGVRLLVEAGYEIEPGTFVRVWGGYQARTQVVGGPALGLEVVVGL